MKNLILCAILIATYSAFGQSAKVIALSKEDAEKAKLLHKQLDDAREKVAKFDDEIKLKYLKAPKEDEGHTQTFRRDEGWVWVRHGWGDGTFEFSDDYRFIVPAAPSKSPTPICTFGSCPFFMTSPGGTLTVAN